MNTLKGCAQTQQHEQQQNKADSDQIKISVLMCDGDNGWHQKKEGKREKNKPLPDL